MGDELVHLDHRVGGDDIAALDDVGLGVDPVLRLGIAGFGLDAGERVEGRHERKVEFVLESVTRHTRQPVVGVQDVGGLDLEVIAHAVGERVDDLGEFFLGQPERAGVDVHDLEPGFDRHALREIVAPATDIDRGVGTAVRERGDQLAHVHVHASGIAAARLDERRRVEREHRDPGHNLFNLRAAADIPTGSA